MARSPVQRQETLIHGETWARCERTLGELYERRARKPHSTACMAYAWAYVQNTHAREYTRSLTHTNAH